MGKFEDISGRVFGKVLAVNRVDDYISPSGRHSIRYLCYCECNKMFVTVKHHLANGRVKSCGCGKGKKAGKGMKRCFYQPVGVDCTKLDCNTCGWNPHNTQLRKQRIKNLIARREANAD